MGGVWIFKFFALHRVVSRRQLLRSNTYDGPPKDAPKLSVLVAAKDEEADIEACISSLLAQDYPDFEIVAIDDRSCDATPDILARLAKQWPDRLRVTTVTSLPDGWMGKSHAMHQGVTLCNGEWLLFTDADCRFTATNALSMAMREAVETDTEFLCITPFLETTAVWEKVIQPVCALVLMVWFVPRKVNNPERKTAYANGAFMLFHRSAYDVIGGHKRVQDQVCEDIQLARIAKRMAVKLRVVETDDLYRTRMYDSLREAWAGWGRILCGSLRTMERLSVVAGVLAFLSIGPWVGLVTTAIAASSADAVFESPLRWPLYAWFGAVLFEQLFMWRVYRLLSMNPLWSLTHVLGAFVTLGIIISAMLQTLGTTKMTWRGTTYRRNENLDGMTAGAASTTEATPLVETSQRNSANA